MVPRRSFSVSTDAPAKINLVLNVMGRRGDGYHEIASLAVGVDLRDHLSVKGTENAGIELSCNEASLATPDNLVVRAARRLAALHGIEPRLRFHLSKRIPVAAGLGGGSSDAAAALRLCEAFWGRGQNSEELSRIGSEVGSDVPLFFQLPAVRMLGRGECVTPVLMAWSGWVLLVTAPVSVSTAAVYASWRQEDATGLADLDAAACAVRADVLNGVLRNDLEPAVFRVQPEVGELQRRLAQGGMGDFRVSGAGSTLFRLFDTWEAANRIHLLISCEEFGCGSVVVPAPVSPGPVIREEF